MFILQSRVNPREVVGGFDSAREAYEWWAARAKLVDHDDLARVQIAWDVIEVANAGDPHDHVLYDYSQTFGPGAYEDISLRMWRDFAVKVEGSYLIYCGEGNTHEFNVDSGIIQKKDWEDLVESAKATREWLRSPNVSVQDIYTETVVDVVNHVLDEEWSDPCQPVLAPGGAEPAGFDEVQPRCDLCGLAQALEGDDWNSETGNHLSCEAKAATV